MVKHGWRNLLTAGDLNVQYQKWLAKYQRPKNDLPQKIYDDALKVGIIIFVKEDSGGVIETIKSIQEQDSPNWELNLIVSPSVSEDISGHLKDMADEDQRLKIVWNNEGNQSCIEELMEDIGTDYIINVKEVDIIHSHAVAAIQMMLAEDNGIDLLYADEDSIELSSGKRLNPRFKPEWSPFLLHCFNYVGSFVAVKKELFREAGGPGVFDGLDKTYEFLLKMTGRAVNVKRIPEVLYSRVVTAAEYYKSTGDVLTNKNLIEHSFERKDYPAKVHYNADTETCSFRIGIKTKDCVSIIIPSKNNGVILERCIESILNKSTYSNYEIILIDNGSTDSVTLQYLNRLKETKNVSFINYPHEFNYPIVNNLAAAHAMGKYLLFLNDDTEVISPDWIEAMLELCQMPGIGAVGALLTFPNGLIQHAGIVVGMRGVASHAFYKSDADAPGYMNLASCVREVSAVTAACMMIRSDHFKAAGGFNPDFRLGLNDVDLCLRLLKMGLKNVFTPHAKLIHYESLTRGEYIDDKEIELFRRLYGQFIAEGDPFYNPGLSLNKNDYSLAV